MAVDMKILLSKFPGDWRLLFAMLCSPEKPLRMAEMWYRQTQFTRQGHRLSWAQFCEACLETEPAIKDGKLVFIPRFLHFPLPYLRLLLAFIHHHKSEVPRRPLAELAGCCHGDNRKDEVIKHLVQLLDNHINIENKKEENNTRETSGEKQMEAELAGSLVVEHMSPTFGLISPGSPEVIDVVTPVPTRRRRPLEPSSIEPNIKRLKLDLDSDLVPQDIEMLLSNHPGAEQTELAETKETSTTTDTTTTTKALTKSMKEQADQLRELLLTSSETDLPEQISLLAECTNQQISELCSYLRVDSLPETAVGLLSHHVCRRHSQFSYHTSLCILTQALLPKVLKMNQRASRALLNSFLMTSKQFPRQLIEGVLVPAMSDSEFGSMQCDLVMKLLEESLSADQKAVLLGQYLLHTQDKPSALWNPSLIALLHHLIEAKVDIAEPDMTRLLTALQVNSFSQAKNLKFGKFILRLINKYGAQLTPSQVSFLRQAVECHQSFLSKSIQAALTKISV